MTKNPIVRLALAAPAAAPASFRHTPLPQSSIDDEYAMAGVKNPKVVITTSRDPSRKLQVFIKELRLVIPNVRSAKAASPVFSLTLRPPGRVVQAIVINRGSTGVPEVSRQAAAPCAPTPRLTAARPCAAAHLRVPEERVQRRHHRVGDSGRGHLAHRLPPSLRPHRSLCRRQRHHSPRCGRAGARAAPHRDPSPPLGLPHPPQGTMSEQVPHLIFDGFQTDLVRQRPTPLPCARGRHRHRPPSRAATGQARDERSPLPVPAHDQG